MTSIGRTNTVIFPLARRFRKYHLPCYRRSKSTVIDVLEQVRRGEISPEEGSKLIASTSPRGATNEEVNSFANIDYGRSKRTGFPEAVFAEGKTPFQVAAILDDMALNFREEHERNMSTFKPIIATRVNSAMFEELAKHKFLNGSVTYHQSARIVSMEVADLKEERRPRQVKGRVVVATAGTTDIPIAEEAAVVLELACFEVDRIYDAGVAGLHRIIRALPRLRDPSVGCIIVCAGMDGALPSVVGGLVSVPVIAVPTSIGYGASFSGVSAMLTMLNSCSPGVAVVNIDNGFGAAAFAFKCLSHSPNEPIHKLVG